jgi:hypothetical protein
MRAFLLGGFIPTCYTQTYVEVAKLEIAMPKIDLNYRPDSYFALKEYGIYLDEIKGAERRKQYNQMLREGSEGILIPLPYKPKLSDEERRQQGGIHPAFMGGEYLPDQELGEVEVARITIASTTQDVTCVYARQSAGQIHYRIVDEYNGSTLEGPKELTSENPITLGELMDFFLKGWDIFCCLDGNFADYNYDPGMVHGFIVSASSSFYGNFGALLTQRINEWLDQVRVDIEDEE